MKFLAALLAGFALYGATLRAQSTSNVPDSHRPPPGMCRIWIDGVPPTHQPAPTDCATAIRKRPLNARVVFGSEAPAGSVRNIAPAPRVQSSFAPPSVAPSAQSREELDRAAQQQRDEQERQRIEGERQREEQLRREPNHAPPPPPPPQQHSQERAAPPPRPRVEKSQRPPQQSHSVRGRR